MKVVFQFNPKLDYDVAINSLGKPSSGGQDKSGAITWVHPELQGLTEKDTDKISSYIDKFYEESLSQEDLDKVEDTWSDVESSYLEAVGKLFKGFKIPKKNVICYLSIFYRNIRIPEESIFQMYYKEPNPKWLISHELLHFAFFYYTRQYLKEGIRGLDTNHGALWDTSEVFNNVVLSSVEFKRILGIEGDKVIPAHKKYLPKAIKMYENRVSIDSYIIELFEFIRSQE